MTRVSRGLLGATRSFNRRMAPSDPKDAAARGFQSLQEAPAGSSVWKERLQWAALLRRGSPDFYGRRIYSEAAITDARFIAVVSRRALRGTLPQTPYAWGRLRAAIVRVYAELGGSDC